MTKSLLLFVIFLTMILSFAFSMNYILGLGYAPSRSWVYKIGAMNGFNDEIDLSIITAASTSQSTNYRIDALIPLLGRNDKNEGYRIGPMLETTISTSTSFDVGIYGQYYIGPWRLGVYLSKPLKENKINTAFDIWYFFSSGVHHFVDYFVADVKVNDIPTISLMFIEPF